MKLSNHLKKAIDKTVKELDRYAFTEGGDQYKFIWKKGNVKKIVKMPQPVPVNHKRRLKHLLENCMSEEEAMMKIKEYISKVFNNARRNLETAAN